MKILVTYSSVTQKPLPANTKKVGLHNPVQPQKLSSTAANTKKVGLHNPVQPQKLSLTVEK